MRYLVVVVLLLSGCATAEQRATQDIARFAPYCEKLGHRASTDNWRKCIQDEAAANPAAPAQRAWWTLTGG